jgi:tuftelin-interacting protein 11
LPPKASAGTTTPAELDDVSFRSVVEEIAAESNLMLLATGKAHEKGYALFRVSQTVDGKSGVTVYLNDDVVWLLDKGEYKPVSVEEMVKRALAK